MEIRPHVETKRLVVEKPRLVYHCPRLTLLGDVASMTETGSMVAMEDFFQNNLCIFANMTGNMC